MGKAPSQFDFWYAVNNTHIIRAPKRHLETFDSTRIHYYLVSELMDEVGKVRVREGMMRAARPQIITPAAYAQTVMEGFGEEAQKYVDWLREHEDDVRLLEYGYTLTRESFSEQTVTDTLDAVIARVVEDVAAHDDGFSAVVQGVDEPWDVSLVRLFWQVMRASVPENVREMNERKFFAMRDGVPAGIRAQVDAAFAAAARDASRIKDLGKFLHEQGLFEQYQDRFFKLIKR